MDMLVVQKVLGVDLCMISHSKTSISKLCAKSIILSNVLRDAALLTRLHMPWLKVQVAVQIHIARVGQVSLLKLGLTLIIKLARDIMQT